MNLLAAFLTIATLLTFSPNKLDKILPAMDGLHSCSCKIESVSFYDRNKLHPKAENRFKLTLRASHKNIFTGKISADWNLVYSFRKKRMDAFKDCDNFIKRVEKARIEFNNK